MVVALYFSCHSSIRDGCHRQDGSPAGVGDVSCEEGPWVLASSKGNGVQRELNLVTVERRRGTQEGAEEEEHVTLRGGTILFREREGKLMGD